MYNTAQVNWMNVLRFEIDLGDCAVAFVLLHFFADNINDECLVY